MKPDALTSCVYPRPPIGGEQGTKVNDTVNQFVYQVRSIHKISTKSKPSEVCEVNEQLLFLFFSFTSGGANSA